MTSRTGPTIDRLSSKSISVGSFLISTLTPIGAQAVRASASVGIDGGSSARVSRTIAAPLASSGSWCTTSSPSAATRTSSSTQSAPSIRAAANASMVFSG
jgi:hypothetical protein